MMILILRKLTFNIQVNLQPWHNALLLWQILRWPWLWPWWFQWPGLYLWFQLWSWRLTVMAVATLIPLSVEDTDHLDSSEELDHYFETQNVCLISIIQYNNSSKKIWPCTWNSLNQLIFLPLMNDSNALFR